MTRSYRYQVVDVFTQSALEGNPLAVFLDAANLDTATMQRIALELNLAETAFILPTQRSDCVARLRIFTPRREMEFAGHPTIGSAFLLSKGRDFCVEENVGVVPIFVDGPMLWLRTPPIKDGPTLERATAATLLTLAPSDLLEATPQVLSAGNPTLFIAVKDPVTVDRAALDTATWATAQRIYPGPLCVFVFAPTPTGAYSRMFAPEYGVVEDPATGSSTGPLALYMKRHGMTNAQRFVSEQGTKMGRRSLLHVRLSGNDIDVGGYVTPIIDAELHL
jgi:trans-2,3-dihydro-3-hydroxyanthranilate isomerase